MVVKNVFEGREGGLVVGEEGVRYDKEGDQGSR